VLTRSGGCFLYGHSLIASSWEFEDGRKTLKKYPLFLKPCDSKGLRQGRFARGLQAIESKGFRQGRFLECFPDSIENKGLRQGRIGAQSLIILQYADSKGFGQGRIFTWMQLCFQVHGNKEVTQEPSCAEASAGRRKDPPTLKLRRAGGSGPRGSA